MEHIWTILCETSIVENQTNLVSLIRLIDRINFALEDNVEEKITVPVSIHVVALWARSDADIGEQELVNVKFISPEKEELATYEYTVDLSQANRFRSTQQIRGLFFTTNGIYRFSVRIQNKDTSEWVEIASVPLEIIRDFPPSDIEEIKSEEAN